MDWTRDYAVTFEFWTVDRDSWGDVKKLDMVESATVKRDLDKDTLGSFSMKTTNEVAEEYIRVYLVATQDKKTEKVCLGTHLCETPGMSYDSSHSSLDIEAYTPLIELNENKPDIGYFLPAGSNVLTSAYMIVREHANAPCVPTKAAMVLSQAFVASPGETWLGYVSALLATVNYRIDLDEKGQIIFAPIRDTASIQPAWTFTDDNTSILYPDIKDTRDLYGIPNVYEAVYSSSIGYITARAVNDDKSSPISTVSRGRVKLQRDTSPEVSDNPTQEELDVYARNKLRNLSTLERTLTFSHSYCPVRIGDAVRIDSDKYNIHTTAKVVTQSIECDTECKVTSTAVYTESMWL